MKTSILNIALVSILTAFTILKSSQHTIAQDKFSLPKLSFSMYPLVECKNFTPQNSAKALRYAHKFQQHLHTMFDTLGQRNEANYYASPQKQATDIMVKFIFFYDRLNQTFRAYKTSANLYCQAVHRITQDTLLQMSTHLGDFEEFDEKAFSKSSTFLNTIVHSSLKNLVTYTGDIAQPNNQKHYFDRSAVIIPHFFTASKSSLKPLARKITHLMNNVLVMHQNQEMQKAWEPASHLVYRFNYYSNYQQNSYRPNSKDFLITGNLYDKNETHYGLQLKFAGQNVNLLLHDSKVETNLEFRKDLIQKQDYSELILKIRKNTTIFVLSNY